MTYFAKYNIETGLYTGSGNVPEDQLRWQLGEGEALLISEKDVVKQEIVDGAPVVSIDLSGVVAALQRKIDQETGIFRSLFITEIPGQAQTYQRKEAEALDWTQAKETANPERYPFIVCEAAARNITTLQVRTEILFQVNALVPVAARIEAERVSAKEKVRAAQTLGEMASAAAVDWQAILSDVT